MAGFILETANAAHAAAIAAIYRPIVEETTISFEERAPSADEMRERIREIGADYPWLVATGDRGVLGYAYACRHRERSAYRFSVDVSVYVAAEARRRGIGAGLYQALFGALAARGFHRAFAGIALPNAGSIALHRNAGFEPVGVYREVGFKFGRRLDVAWYAKALA